MNNIKPGVTPHCRLQSAIRRHIRYGDLTAANTPSRRGVVLVRVITGKGLLGDMFTATIGSGN